MKTVNSLNYTARLVLFMSIPLLLGQCSVAPINSSFESARMLEKDEVEVTGGYARYSFAEEGLGDRESTNSNITIRAGIGLSDRVDLKARYTRLMIADTDGALSGEGLNYIHVAPKVGIIPDYFALSIPLGVYFDNDGSAWVTSPKLIGTYPHKSNKFDASLGFKADIFLPGGKVYLGFTLGMGFSSDLDKWAVRPEIGYMINPGESGHVLTWGIGLIYIFPKQE